MSSLVSLQRELNDVMDEWERIRGMEERGEIHSQWKYERKITDLKAQEVALRALIAQQHKAKEDSPPLNLSQEA